MYKSSQKSNKNITMDNSGMGKKVKHYKKSKSIYESTIWMYKTTSAYKTTKNVFQNRYQRIKELFGNSSNSPHWVKLSNLCN